MRKYSTTAIRHFALLFLFITAIKAKISIISRQNNDSYYDRIASYGPRIPVGNADSDGGIEGYLVAVERLERLHPVQPTVDLMQEGEDVVLIHPAHGCYTVHRPSWIPIDEPWIALVERGGCSFVEKTRAMQKSGAMAVVVGNNEMSSGLITMYANTDTSDINIASTFVMQWVYRDLRFLSTKHYDDKVTDQDELKDPSLRIRITASSDFEWPILDVIVITVIAPAVILAFLYSLWRFRQRSQVAIRNHEEESLSAVDGLLPIEDLQHLTVKSFDSHNMESMECETCAICLDELETGDQIRILVKCGHSFHVKCIDIWLTTRRRVCPICKCDAWYDEKDEQEEQEESEERPLLPTRRLGLDQPAETVVIAVDNSDNSDSSNNPPVPTTRSSSLWKTLWNH